MAGGSGKGAEFPILTEGTVPQGNSGTKNLNNSLNVNNLKILLFNCFPSSAAGLCRRGCTGKLVVNHHCTEDGWGVDVGWGVAYWALELASGPVIYKQVAGEQQRSRA